MNAVEIEAALDELSTQPFDPNEFPFAFLAAFGNRETTLRRLRKGDSNATDVEGAVLQRNNVHILAVREGSVSNALRSLRSSPRTAQAKARYILATDGTAFEAEDTASGEGLACEYVALADHFGFFLPLAGISTVKEIKDNPIDIRATGRLNKLYVELLRANPKWAETDRRSDMNHFMARLIFCFFAEDTDIFAGDGLFTRAVDTLTERDGANVHEVLGTIFRAMNMTPEERKKSDLPRWADAFPYVNGGLFSGSTDVPLFTRTARAYLFQAGQLNWRAINPDIFGSMIQAVADDEERGALGMHYTSVPNILKVLNPLFLDDLRTQMDAAGDNKTKLLNLRRRMSRIRVFDPACGSGNFLVIAYKQMRAIEAEINIRRGEIDRPSDIPIKNFRGIELRDFPAEIARLALIIAEFQCDVLYRGQKEALNDVLPLDADNWITCGNALRLDWLKICPPTGTGVKLVADDLFQSPLDQAEVDFDNEGGETFICGNPPYLGNKLQTEEQKSDLSAVFLGRTDKWRSLDYVAGWLMKAADYGLHSTSSAALVATNSICQGQQVPILWPLIFGTGNVISFAYSSFKWTNLASHNAGVTVVILGLSNVRRGPRTLFASPDDGTISAREVANINAYLAPSAHVIVEAAPEPINGLMAMRFGNMPRDAGHLLLSPDERDDLVTAHPNASAYLRDYVGSEEAIRGKRRICIWVAADQVESASLVPELKSRFDAVRHARASMKAASTQAYASKPYRFVQIQGVAEQRTFLMPRVSSESRPYLPAALYDYQTIVADSAFALYDAPLWHFSLMVSRMHLVWVGAVCGKLKTDFRYSNTLGWNTFPLPTLTEQNRIDLDRCAQNILLAREAHFPASLASLYDAAAMPADLQHAHEQNDEVLERIYIGRRFRNDTERSEKLFELYTKLAAVGRAGRPISRRTTR